MTTTITDVKGRKIEVGTKQFFNKELTVAGQKASLYDPAPLNANGSLALRIRAPFDSWAVSRALNVPSSAIDAAEDAFIAIDKAAFAQLAAFYNEQAGEDAYMYSVEAEHREIPSWANDCDSGSFNWYVAADGNVYQKFHGFY